MNLEDQPASPFCRWKSRGSWRGSHESELMPGRNQVCCAQANIQVCAWLQYTACSLLHYQPHWVPPLRDAFVSEILSDETSFSSTTHILMSLESSAFLVFQIAFNHSLWNLPPCLLSAAIRASQGVRRTNTNWGWAFGAQKGPSLFPAVQMTSPIKLFQRGEHTLSGLLRKAQEHQFAADKQVGY